MTAYAVGPNYIRARNNDDPLRAGELSLDCEDLELTVINYATSVARPMTPDEIIAYQAALDAAAAEKTQLQSDKADMKTAYTTAVNRLQTISTATFANNAQRDTAIQDLAKYLLALAKVVKGLL